MAWLTRPWREILAAHPEVASSDIHMAALLGNHEAVARFLAEDRANATAKGGPRNWDALTHLCFYKFLRLEPARPMPTRPTARSRSVVPCLPLDSEGEG